MAGSVAGLRSSGTPLDGPRSDSPCTHCYPPPAAFDPGGCFLACITGAISCGLGSPQICANDRRENWVENRIRPIALGRQNWLFAGSLRAGKGAAVVMSLICAAP